MMKNVDIMGKFLFACILSFFCFSANAQEISFKTIVPKTLVKGEQFYLIYALEGANSDDFEGPSEVKGLSIMYGPAPGLEQSVMNVNGKVTSSVTKRFTYTMMATDVGTFTVPGATVRTNGKTYKSSPVQVKVLPPDKNAQAQSNGRGQPAITSSSSTGKKISASDAFIRPIVSKTKIFEQEGFVVTFRFYTVLNVRDLGKIEFPEFNGFMVEDQDLPATRQLQLEHYNGRNYYSVDLKRSLLFPQQSGPIVIPPGKIEMVFSVNSGQVVDDFIFGPQAIMTDVKHTMTTNPITINVTPLPVDKPADFSNGVGTFNLSESISATNVKANDAITLTLKISGTGNMKLIKTPELVLPKDFEKYDPKITNDLNFTDKGLAGTKTIEYLFIPRYPGTFKVPSLEFSYFDPTSQTYKVLKTKEYTLDIAKDPNAGTNNSAANFTQTEVQVEKDIRHIKTDAPSSAKKGNFIYGSLAYWLWCIIPTLLFITFFILYRKQIKENADIIRMKTKHANKVAIKRLKQAQIYLQAQKKESFYEEVLRAVWGYLSDKLVIPVANLNRENIEQELNRFGASDDLIKKVIYVLDTCEFARYAPVESDTAMDDLYKDAVDAIGEMEDTRKGK